MSPEQAANKIGKSVGEKLRAARIAQNYTQSQLAAPDFSVSYISAIERGQIHPSLRALEILATRLGLSSTQLLPNHAQQDDQHSTLALSEREDDEVDIALLDAQILILQGSAAQTITQLEQLSNRRLKHQQQLRCRYLLGWAYFATAHLQEAEYILSEATQLAKEASDHYLNLRVLNLLGIAYATMHNYTQAILSHQRCLNILQERSDRQEDAFFVAQIYMQMGQHYTQLEKFDQAYAMFHRAISITDNLATPQQTLSTYTNLCRHHSRTNEYALAALYAHKCLHLSTHEARKRLRSELYHYLGRAVIKQDQEKARVYLDEISQDASIAQEPLVQTSLATHIAEWYFLQHEFENAEIYAQRACDLLLPGEDTVIAAEAYIMLGRINYACKYYEDGDKHFVEGLAMLERLNNQEELVDQAAGYAQLLEERGQVREAFTYFRRAFQGSQRMGR